MIQQTSSTDTAAVTTQLERVLNSRVFAKAVRSQRMLRFLVDAALADPLHLVKEYTLATEVFDRDPGYDPAIAATVRVEAGRMRSRLREYYHEEGRQDPVLIEVPRGGYAVVLTVREAPPTSERPVEIAPDPSEASVPAPQHVRLPPAPESSRDATATPPATSLSSRLARSLTHWYAPSILFALLLGYGTWSLSRMRPHRPAIHSLAVLPLRNLSGDGDQDYFADGMTDELTTELARIHGLRVVSRTSVMEETKSQKSLSQIAQELRVDAVVEGSVTRSGNRVRITAQLIDALSDKHLWADSFEGPADDVLSLQDNVAREIATQARVALTRENLPGPALRMNPVAHDDYLRGRYFFDRGEYRLSATYFRQAIAIEPNQSASYAGLADALEAGTTFGIGQPRDTIPEALAAAKHAIALDPTSGEAYTALGSIQTLYGWNWAEAEQNLVHGIALSPSYPLAEAKYAMYLDAVGRPQEAVEHMRRALELDPLSFFMTRRLGATLYLNRQYDDAILQLQRANELDPHLPSAIDSWMSAAYLAKGMLDTAVEHNLAARQEDWSDVDMQKLRSVYKQHGWSAFWRARLKVLQGHKADVCTPYEEGMTYVLLSEPDRAFASLLQAVDQRCFQVVRFRTEPLLDPIRSDPRFATLLRRAQLPDAAQLPRS